MLLGDGYRRNTVVVKVRKTPVAAMLTWQDWEELTGEVQFTLV
jgi:hypothetical protein